MRTIIIATACMLALAGCARKEESLSPEQETAQVRANTLIYYERTIESLDALAKYSLDFDSFSHPDDLRRGKLLCDLRSEMHEAANELRDMIERPQEAVPKDTRDFCASVDSGIERNR